MFFIYQTRSRGCIFFPQWHLKDFFFFVFKCFCFTYINTVLTPKIYSRVTLDKGKTLVWEIRLALFVITILFTDPGCCSTHSSGKQEFSFFPPAAVEIKIKKQNLQTCKILILSSEKFPLPVGLLGACWICSKKPHRHLFIPEILPVCRCVVLVQQQCFAKLQSEMNQLARPPACQPSHSAKTDDRGPLVLLHNSSCTSSF